MRKTSALLSIVGSMLLSACATSVDNPTSTSTTGGGEGGQGAQGGGGGGQGGEAGGGGQGGEAGQGGGGAQGGSGGGEPDLCGNGVKDPGEQCDGADFGGQTCADFGLSGGNLLCNPFCGVVVSYCTPAETCLDSMDNDQDGLMDCDDSDCSMEPLCTDSCIAPKTLTLPAYTYGSTEGRPSTYGASCSPSTGREMIFDFIAPTTGPLTAQLYSWGGTDFSLSIRTACADAAAELACKNDVPANGFDPELLTIEITQGTHYYLMVDGQLPVDGGQFDLQLYVPLPEDYCSDLYDDDNDGYVDCDDATACQGTFECAPGTVVTGQACYNPWECTANANDPVCLPDWLGYPGGYCSQFCNLAMNDCGGDGICADIGLSVNGVCLDGCVTNADCRPGYACVDKGFGGLVCAQPPEAMCADNTDNDFNNFFDCEDTGCQSTAACAPGIVAVGQPCTQNNQCTANSNDPLCFDPFYWGWPGGYCTQFCDVANDDCGALAVCADIYGFPSGNGVCMDKCNTPADCRSGYYCVDYGLSSNICVY